MAKKRRYSDEERAACLAALAANGDDLSRTARQVGVPRQTLQQWRDAARLPNVPKPSAEEIRQGKNKDVEVAKESLAVAVEKVARSLVTALEGKLPSASLKDSAVAFGILVDKMQLLRGEPTSIDEQRDRARLDEFRKRYGASRGGGSDAARNVGTDAVGQPVHSPPADAAAD